MNESNVTSSPLAGVTTTELWIQNVFFYIILDIPATIGNFFVFILIVRTPNLKTFFFALIAGHTLGRSLFSLQMMVLGIYRICRTLVPSFLYLTTLQCHSVQWLCYFFDSFNSVTLCVLAIDRLVAVAAPLKYHTYSAKMGVTIILGVCFFIIVSRVIPSYLFTNTTDYVIACVNFLSPVPLFWGLYSLTGNVVFGIIAVILYCVLNIVVRVRISKIQKNYDKDDNERVNQLVKNQMKMLPLLNFLIVTNLFCVVIVQFLMLLASIFPPEISTRVVMYAANLACFDRLFDFIILLRKSTELRKAIKIFFSTESRVGAINSAPALISTASGVAVLGQGGRHAPPK